jgi:hypothetical protein
VLHIREIRKKLDKYFSKNRLLNSRYFSVRSVMTLFEYYHKSRLLYGMNAFIDLLSPMKNLESCFMSALKNILKLPIRTNTDRLTITLGLPDLIVYLASRTVKSLTKYKKIFGEEVQMYDEKIKEVLGSTKETLMELSCKELEDEFDMMFDENITTVGRHLGIAIRPGLKKRLSKEVYTWYVSKDFYLVKYLCNRGFFRNDIMGTCKHCGEENTREHAVDSCIYYDELRERTKIAIGKVDSILADNNLSLAILRIYFYPDTDKLDQQQRKKLIQITKNFVHALYIEQHKEET